MAKLTVTARGQVTFRKKVMEHLGVKPGGKIELDLLPDGQGMIRSARPTGKIEDFIGMLAGKTKKVATIEEMNEAAAAGWAGEISFDESKPVRNPEKKMKVTVDTNILVRAVVRDDLQQAEIAAKTLVKAEVLVVGVACLCEFVWVLRRAYGYRPSAIAAAIRKLLQAENVETNRPAVEAGLAMLDGGGDFADGVIVHEGQWLGGKTFVSFDKKAVEMLKAQGQAAKLL